MELCDGGELFDRMVKKKSFTEDEARKVFYQLMKAIQYLHSRKVCHRDLKPENLMFLSPNDDLLKVIDFGVSKFFSDSSDTNSIIKLTTTTGSYRYIAPEV